MSAIQRSLSQSENPTILKIAEHYISVNKSKLARKVKEILSSNADFPLETLECMCKYLTTRNIPMETEITEWIKTNLKISEQNEQTPGKSKDHEIIQPQNESEKLSAQEDREARSPDVTNKLLVARSLKSLEKGEHKSQKAKIPKDKKTKADETIEPVELTVQQITEIEQAEEEDSQLLAELVPHLSKYDEGKTTHFSARAVHLTLKDHYDYIPLLEYYKALLPEKTTITSYSLVREVGLKRGYKHTHVLLVFNKKIQVRGSFFCYISKDQEKVQPNIRAKNHRASIEQVVFYHYKDGDFPHTNIRIKYDCLGAEKISRLISMCTSATEAVERFCKPDLSNIKDIKLAYDTLHVEENVSAPLTHLRNWQRDVMISLRRNNHPRQILFVVDTAGKAGKTRFAEHVASQLSTLHIRLCNSRDIGCVLAGHYARSREKKIECIVFDFARSVGDISDVYDMLEQVRDGRITSGKYVSQTICLNPPPRVLVLTNNQIDITKLTLDRYRIWYILVDRESSIPIGKKLLLNYVNDSGNVTPEAQERFSIDMENLKSKWNREIKRLAIESGYASESSAGDGEPTSLEKLDTRIAAEITGQHKFRVNKIAESRIVSYRDT